MATKKTPRRTVKYPFVSSRKRADGTLAHRGYAVDAYGEKVFGETFDDPYRAHLDALDMRGEAANMTPAYSLDEAIDALLVEARTKRTKGTVRWYADHLRAICRLIPGETALHDITRATVEQYIRERLRPADGKRRCGAATVNADLRALHRVFAFAILQGNVKENPVPGVARPRADEPAMDWFTEDEMRDLVLAKIRLPRHRDIVHMMAATGVRRREAASLAPGHVRLNLGQLIVPGKNRTRAVPLAPDAQPAMKRLLAGAGALLIPGGTHELDDVFRAAKEDTGDRRVHAHAMRHTFCTTLIRKGVRPDVVMRLADHRSITTTMRYVHEVGGEGEAAVRLFRFAPPSESDPAASE